MGHSREQRMQLVREWKRSGLKAADFARQRGIKRQSLHNWSWQLNRETTKRKHKQKRSDRGLRLLPVHVTPSVEVFGRADQLDHVSGMSVEVLLDGRVRVDVDLDTDLRRVATLVAMLRAATC
jgi:transposase-like protein